MLSEKIITIEKKIFVYTCIINKKQFRKKLNNFSNMKNDRFAK